MTKVRDLKQDRSIFTSLCPCACIVLLCYKTNKIMFFRWMGAQHSLQAAFFRRLRNVKLVPFFAFSIFGRQAASKPSFSSNTLESDGASVCSTPVEGICGKKVGPLSIS